MHSKTLTTFMVVALSYGCAPGYAPPDSTGDNDATLTDNSGVDAADAGFDAVDDDAQDTGEQDDAGSDTADTSGRDGGADDAGDDGDTGSSTCTPNHDGKIERSEVTLRPGLHATFRVAEDVAVDVRGTERADGSRVWDLSGEFDGDRSVLVELQSLDGTWYNPEFPDADYASKLADSEDEIGVFGAAQDGLYLHGVVTPDDGWSRTELAYDPPAKILAFPMEQGATWSSDSDISGWYLGGYWTADEEYQSQVDAHGTLETPFGDFPVLRVRTDMTRTVGFSVTTQITYSFVSECFGTVATIRSKENEDEAEFTEAAEVRRLTR